MQPTIGIIGGGNMGNCLIGGLIKHGYAKEKIKVADHSEQTCVALKQKWGVFSTTDNQAVAAMSQIIVLAVKPNQIKAVLQNVALTSELPNKLFISIAAGMTTQQIQHGLGSSQVPIVRAMPNTPALFGQGITGLYATPFVSFAQKEQAQKLFDAVGQSVWVEEESLIDVVTALSGSGPAYFFYIMESFIQGAQALGLSEEAARKLTLETALGSTHMALHASQSLAALRQNVTSPGGTTQAGIQVLKDGKLDALLLQTLKAAVQRAKELSQQY